MAEKTSRKDGRGMHTLGEIRSQADSWESSLAAVNERSGALRDMLDWAEEIVVSGCGSAFNVAHAVAPFFQEAAGKTCRAVHSSDIALNPSLFLNGARRTLAVVCSRSGDTTESVLALRTARSRGCRTLAVTCFPRSAMAREADALLPLEGAVERSVATTRSLTSMVIAGYALAALSNDGRGIARSLAGLPEAARRGMRGFEELGGRVGEDRGIGAYAFLGTGCMYGLAREAQLKIKEMAILPSDSYVTLDFRHGPMSNADGRMLVTILASAHALEYERGVARDMKALGAKVFALCCGGGDAFADSADYRMDVESLAAPARGPDGQVSARTAPSAAASAAIAGVLYMPALQFMAYYTSIAAGYDPDNPRNLSYCVTVT